MRFIGYEDQVRKFGEPDAGNYTLVFDGDLGTSDLEQIYTIRIPTPFAFICENKSMIPFL